MRDILFKAKGQTDEKWHIGFLSNLYGGICIIRENEHEWICQADTLCQYTGLTDKNGNKIWENDVVKYHFGEDTAVIRFGKYQSCFDSQKSCHVGFYVDWKDYKRKDLGYWVEMIDCNVIGNIFDNPELLGV